MPARHWRETRTTNAAISHKRRLKSSEIMKKKNLNHDGPWEREEGLSSGQVGGVAGTVPVLVREGPRLIFILADRRTRVPESQLTCILNERR